MVCSFYRSGPMYRSVPGKCSEEASEARVNELILAAGDVLGVSLGCEELYTGILEW